MTDDKNKDDIDLLIDQAKAKIAFDIHMRDRKTYLEDREDWFHKSIELFIELRLTTEARFKNGR